MSVAVRRLSAGRTVNQLLVVSAGLGGVMDSILSGAPTPAPPLYAPSIPLRPLKPPSERELRSRPTPHLLAGYSTTSTSPDDFASTDYTKFYHDTGPAIKPLEPNPKKRKGGDLEGNTQKPRAAPVRTGNDTSVMKWLIEYYGLSEDVIEGIFDQAAASDVLPLENGVELSDSRPFAQAEESFRLMEEYIFSRTHQSLEETIFQIGVAYELQQFVGLKYDSASLKSLPSLNDGVRAHVDAIDAVSENHAVKTRRRCRTTARTRRPLSMRYEVTALEADLAGEPIDAPKDPEHYKSEIVLVKHALNGDAVRAQREGGHAALVSESVPRRLIKVAVQLLPEEDRAVVARMLAEQRLALLKGTLQDDSSRACPCCGTVCRSAREARVHLMRSSPLCAWDLFLRKMEGLPYCRGCKNRACDRMEGGKKPFCNEAVRDRHEKGLPPHFEGFVRDDAVPVKHTGFGIKRRDGSTRTRRLHVVRRGEKHGTNGYLQFLKANGMAGFGKDNGKWKAMSDAEKAPFLQRAVEINAAAKAAAA